MNVSPRVSDMHARFCVVLTHRYFIRAHMAVMLALVLLSGVLAGRLLLRAGISNMGLRYPIAVLVSYGAFFGLIRIWLAYVCRADRAGRIASLDGSGGGSSGGSGWSFGSGSGSGSGGSSSGFASGGGSGGGGGASSSWEGDAPSPASPVVFGPPSSAVSPASSGHASGSLWSRVGGGSGGGGGDGDGLLLLVLFCLLVAAIFGAGAYVVYQAPVFLSDAAFHAVLAGGLARTARGVHDRGWMGGVLKATAIPFAIVLVLAGVFGYEANVHCPGSTTVRQVFRTCILG